MERYLGLDVHARSCTLAVISKAGKKLKDVVIETNGQALIEAIRTIPGRKHLCLEEGTQSAWLYEILQPHVHEFVVTTVPKSRGKKSDKADAYQRAEELLRGTIDRRVFKSPQTYARLRELARSHQTTVRDRVRVQARLKTIYRSRGIPSGGPALYGVRRRGEWFEKLPEPCQRRALHLYTQLDFLVEQERKIEAELLEELSKHRMAKVLQTIRLPGDLNVIIQVEEWHSSDRLHGTVRAPRSAQIRALKCRWVSLGVVRCHLGDPGDLLDIVAGQKKPTPEIL